MRLKTCRVQKRDNERAEVQAEFERMGDDMIIGSTVWLSDDGLRHARAAFFTYDVPTVPSCGPIAIAIRDVKIGLTPIERV